MNLLVVKKERFFVFSVEMLLRGVDSDPVGKTSGWAAGYSEDGICMRGALVELMGDLGWG